ncbi:aspartate aminotransferase family protein [Zooshikella ganghwensis]|uniref:aspartate aminotransferase family protein n=1 Tax=Zooshikella ganghwensis TaxID=202772 RepID=UPI000401A752|nr:aspartate aminotransferase family protein [Zooshikella ganghwensis]
MDNNNTLDAYWMGYTANQHFKAHPRLLEKAKGMYYWTPEGRKILDATAGLWCVNAGHNREKIVTAIQQQAATLDFAPAFQMGHPKAFELAKKLVAITPGNLNHVFFTNSGSESVDTALKIALAYHQLTGEGRRTRLIGRERAYHGVNFGGMSVGGIAVNRKLFPNLLAQVDHLPHTHDLARNQFSLGVPVYGADKADRLEQIVQLHDPSTVAAVIIEPVAGSTGVLIPPADYLQRIREICDQYGVLLIFDEVITGFGRLGKPFAADYFNISPDIMVTAKGLTNGAVPMGAVFVSDKIYSAFRQDDPMAINFYHGYTYSAHPLACAAAIGTLETYQEENLLYKASELAEYWQHALHSLADLPYVIDIRNLGLVGAIELEPRKNEPNKRAFRVYLDMFEQGVLVRTTGDVIALSPPLIISKPEVDQIIITLRQVLKQLSS